jgi:hypothetical protein
MRWARSNMAQALAISSPPLTASAAVRLADIVRRDSAKIASAPRLTSASALAAKGALPERSRSSKGFRSAAQSAKPSRGRHFRARGQHAHRHKRDLVGMIDQEARRLAEFRAQFGQVGQYAPLDLVETRFAPIHVTSIPLD